LSGSEAPVMDTPAGSIGNSKIPRESQMGVVQEEKDLLGTLRLRKTTRNAIRGIRQSENRQEILSVVRASKRFTDIDRIARRAE
jgi:hypothetical protein